MEPAALFSRITGLEVEDGTEAEVVRQIRQYQRSQASKSHTGQHEETEDNFEF